MKINNKLIDFDYLTKKLADNDMLATNEVTEENIEINNAAEARIVNISIYGKTEQDKDFSPDNPKEFGFISELKYKNQNANIYDERILNSIATNVSSGVYNFNNQTAYEKNFTEGIKFKENTRYTFFYTGRQVQGNPRLRFEYTDGTTTDIATMSTTFQEYRKTSDAGKTIKRITEHYGDGGGFYIKQNSCCLVEEIATEFIPHQEQNLTIDLGDKSIANIDDAEDELVIDMETGEVSKIEIIGNMTLNGTENWQVGKSGTENYYYEYSMPLTQLAIGNTINSNKYKKSYIIADNVLQGIYNTNNKIRIRYGEEMSLNEFKQSLADSNLKVIYKKESSVIKYITTLSKKDLQKLKLFNKINYINISTNLGDTKIKVKYIKNQNC